MGKLNNFIIFYLKKDLIVHLYGQSENRGRNWQNVEPENDPGSPQHFGWGPLCHYLHFYHFH